MVQNVLCTKINKNTNRIEEVPHDFLMWRGRQEREEEMMVHALAVASLISHSEQ